MNILRITIFICTNLLKLITECTLPACSCKAVKSITITMSMWQARPITNHVTQALVASQGP